MDLRGYVETIHQQLLVAADAGGDEARALAERLSAPLDAAIRLTLQDALTAAAEEITCELAPGAVELRLRGGDLEFVVTPAPIASPIEDGSEGRAPVGAPPGAADGDDGSMARINVRMPDHLKSRVEAAAARQGLSVNAWLVRAAAAAVGHSDPDRRAEMPSARAAQRYTGWAR